MNSKYKISIIIPTYNAEKYLKRCIDSLLNQTFGFENIEVILIDDNSTDSTKNIILELSDKYKNIVPVFCKENSGSPSKPRNIGIKKASAEYIMFMDNDDEFYPDMCEVMYNTIINKNVDIVTCRPSYNKDGIEYKEKTFLNNEKEFLKIKTVDEYPKMMSSGVTMFIWNKIFKKDLLIKNNIRFPEKDLYEDVYFATKSYLNAEGIVLLNDYWGYKYNIRTKGMDKSTSQDYTEENLIKQINGLNKLINLLNKSDAHYPTLECEMLVGITKLFICTNPPDNEKRRILTETRELYTHYKWNVRLVNVSLALNIFINIFMKIFSLNITLAIFIVNFLNLFHLNKFLG